MSDSPAVIIYDSSGNPVKLFDLDTDAGTEHSLGVSIRLPSSGGSVPGGTNTSPIRIDPTGTTTQPISALSLPLPNGAATEITVASLLTSSTFTSRINTLGQKTMANSTPVVIASDQNSLTVSGTVIANIGTTNGLALDSTLTGGTQKAIIRGGAKGSTTAADVTSVSIDVNTQALHVQLASQGSASVPLRIDPTGSTTQPVSAASLPLPSGAATEATLSTRLSDTTFTARINTLGQKSMANSTPVVIASDQTDLAITASSLPLPSGAATETTLSTRLSETTFTNRTNTLGQKAMSGSMPVVIASDQSILTVTGNVNANVSGTITANIGTTNGLALDTTVSTRLADSTFIARINTLGQKTMSQSTPVVLASNQSAVPVTIVDGGAGGGVSKSLYDIGNTEIYIGTAAQGTASSAAAWLIKKVTLDLSGNPVSSLYSSDTAIWDNRLTESYS